MGVSPKARFTISALATTMQPTAFWEHGAPPRRSADLQSAGDARMGVSQKARFTISAVATTWEARKLASSRVQLGAPLPTPSQLLSR